MGRESVRTPEQETSGGVSLVQGSDCACALCTAGSQSRCRVSCQVALQQCAMGENLATGRAGSTLRPVGAHVHIERALLREALGTHSTLEGSHTGVCDHMFEQVVA